MLHPSAHRLQATFAGGVDDITMAASDVSHRRRRLRSQLIACALVSSLLMVVGIAMEVRLAGLSVHALVVSLIGAGAIAVGTAIGFGVVAIVLPAVGRWLGRQGPGPE